jgi:uroporphyrinogen-III synthase
VSPDAADERVGRLIDAIVARQLDALTFTSAPAVHALFGAAEALGRIEPLLDAMRTDVLSAAVGPVTAAPLEAAGIQPIQPQRYRMGALIRLVCEYLEQNRVPRVETRHGEVALRGACVDVGGRRIALSPAAESLMRALVAANGGVVSRAELAALLPGTVDDHAMEVTLSRLRQTLGVPGLVQTVVKRGYRLDV